MAPKIGSHQSQQCIMPQVQDFRDDDLNLDFRDEAGEVPELLNYSYLQITDYRSQRKRNDGPLKPLARWVPLPMEVCIHGVSVDDVVCTSQRETRAEPLRSCIRQLLSCKRSTSVEDEHIMENWDTESSVSTVATSSERRRVKFPDGLSPGCWEEIEDDLSEDPANAQWESHSSAALAEWIFIDRDICGYSLYEYAPDDDEMKEFASSPFANMFIKELENIEFVNMYNQQTMMQCEEYASAHRQEERQLDKALLLAGVHVNCIHSAPEEQDTEVCI